MSDKEFDEMMEFLREKIPLKLDLRTEDLRYDQRSMYYKIYRYIAETRKKWEEKWR